MVNQSHFMSLLSTWLPTIKAALLLITGIPIIMWSSRFIQNRLVPKLGKHIAFLIHHSILYGGIIVVILMALTQLNFDVSALLGAAGILGVTIGFAAQTSVSNIISGIFILLERSLKVGDEIECQQSVGTVQSIDLLSIQIKTYDGQLIRIPNEIVLKNTVKNKTFYPSRRLSFYIVIRNETPINDVTEIIDTILKTSDLILKTPNPSIMFNKIYPWGTKLIIKFWTHSHTAPKASSEFLQSCNQALQNKNITIYQNI